MEEAIVCLRNHRASVDAHTADRSSSPDRVAREEVVIFRCAEEAYDAELHHHLVDEFLCLALCERAVLEVALDEDVEERTYTTERHGSSVLVLNGTEITEVSPLYSLLGVACGLCNVKAVRSTHSLKLLQSLYLLRNFLAMTNYLFCKLLYVDALEVALLLLDEVSSSVECHTTIVADDASTSVSVRQTGDNVGMTCSLDIIVVC